MYHNKQQIGNYEISVEEEEKLQYILSAVKIILLQNEFIDVFVELNGVSLCIDMIKAKNFMTVRAIEFLDILSANEDITDSLIDENILGLVFPFFEYDIIEFKSKEEESLFNENLIGIIFNFVVLLKDEKLSRTLNRISKPGFVKSVLKYRKAIAHKIKSRLKKIESTGAEDRLAIEVEEGLLIKYKISFILCYFIITQDVDTVEMLATKNETGENVFSEMKAEAVELGRLIDNQRLLNRLSEINLI